MQVDRVARVRLDVGVKGRRGRESSDDAAGDRTPQQGRVARRQAVAAAEDEVLICGGDFSQSVSQSVST